METPQRMREEVERLLCLARSETDREIKTLYATRAYRLAQLAEATERAEATEHGVNQAESLPTMRAFNEGA